MANLFASAMRLLQLAAKPATPPAGESRMYFKTDGKPYYVNSDGVETAFGTGTGGGDDWRSAAGAPSGSSLPVGTWYEDTNNYNVYEQTAAGVWTPRGDMSPSTAGQPAYHGEWATIDGQNVPSGTWTGRFGWQPGWNATGNAGTAPAPVGILDSTHGSNPAEFIVVNAGFYQINCTVSMASDTPSYSRQMRLLLNGSVLASSAVQLPLNNNLSMGTAISCYCPANSVIRVEGWQNSGAAVAWNTNYDRNFFSIFSLGQGPKGDPGGSAYTPNQATDMWSTSTQSIATATWTTITGWSPTTSNIYWSAFGGGVATISVPGLYLMTAHVTFGANTGARNLTALYRNGNEFARQDSGNSNGGVRTINTVAFQTFNIGDTVNVAVWQNTGSALSLAGTAPPGPYALGGHHWQMWKVSDQISWPT